MGDIVPALYITKRLWVADFTSRQSIYFPPKAQSMAPQDTTFWAFGFVKEPFFFWAGCELHTGLHFFTAFGI
jgi:hypothetical protein